MKSRDLLISIYAAMNVLSLGVATSWASTACEDKATSAYQACVMKNNDWFGAIECAQKFGENKKACEKTEALDALDNFYEQCRQVAEENGAICNHNCKIECAPTLLFYVSCVSDCMSGCEDKESHDFDVCEASVKNTIRKISPRAQRRGKIVPAVKNPQQSGSSTAGGVSVVPPSVCDETCVAQRDKICSIANEFLASTTPLTGEQSSVLTGIAKAAFCGPQPNGYCATFCKDAMAEVCATIEPFYSNGAFTAAGGEFGFFQALALGSIANDAGCK